MAHEFKVKNGLLIEGSTNSQPVIAVRNASTEITQDASSLLVTAKAIHDYVDSQLNPLNTSLGYYHSWNLSQDASIQRIDASINNTIDAYSIFILNTSLGTDFYWENGYIEVSVGGGTASDASLTQLYNWQLSQDASINILRAKDASQDASIAYLSGWNLSQDGSISFLRGWELSQDASIIALRTTNTNQDTSIALLNGWQVSQDASIIALRTANTNQDTSIALLNGWQVSQDASIITLRATNVTQDASITSLRGWELSQDASIIALRAIDVTQDASIVSLRTTNTNQDSSILLLNGWNISQDASIVFLKGWNLSQDGSISFLRGWDLSQDASILAIRSNLESSLGLFVLKAGDTMTGPLVINSGGGLSVLGDVSILSSHNLYVDGNAAIKGSLTINGSLYVVDRVNILSDVSISSDLTVSSDIINPGMPNASTNYTVYFDTTTKKLSYADAPSGGDVDISTLSIESYVNTSTYYDSSIRYRTMPEPSTGFGSGNGAEGLFVNFKAANTISSYYCGYIDTGGRIALADADASNMMPAVAINTTGSSLSAGTNYNLLIYGVVRNTAWNFAIGQPVYVGLSGEVTTTMPSSAPDCVQVIGRTVSPDSIIFNPSPDFVVLK